MCLNNFKLPNAGSGGGNALVKEKAQEPIALGADDDLQARLDSLRKG